MLRGIRVVPDLVTSPFVQSIRSTLVSRCGRHTMASQIACSGCRDGNAFSLPFSMAFQPIVDVASGRIFAHEALVRGIDGGGAANVLRAVVPDNKYAFDQACRTRALELASELALAKDGTLLSINFLPNAVYEPKACIRATLRAAKCTGFPLDQIIFEFTEDERLETAHILNILETYRAMGFKTAIDDFGAGYSGLSLLAKFQPDIVKLDMSLIRDIDREPPKRAIVRGLVRMLRDLGVLPVGEGVETTGEYAVLRDLGIDLLQGYLLARPAFQALAVPILPDLTERKPTHRRRPAKEATAQLMSA